jgi:hypothetical protein
MTVIRLENADVIPVFRFQAAAAHWTRAAPADLRVCYKPLGMPGWRAR